MPTTAEFDLALVLSSPARYSMQDFSANCAYVGISIDLRWRLNQHFVGRDSSVTTGVSASSLNF